jgi:hypothetical protein
MRLIMESGADRCCQNLPMGNELAIVIPNEYGEQSKQDIVPAVREPGRNHPQLKCINVTHTAYMPLHYVLLFPYRDKGWHWGLQLCNRDGVRQRTRLDQQPFYRYCLHVRIREFSALFYTDRLFQQYIVDAFGECLKTVTSDRNICYGPQLTPMV